MPRAKEKSSNGLSIDLDDPRKFWTPGSKISGHVTLNTAQDFAIGTVSVEFYGRVKVFFVWSHGQGESHHRGRAPLFSERNLLYEGYHTHKPGSFSWPFVLELPTSPDVEAIRESKHQWQAKEHFLATDDYILAHPMPPTFRMRKWGFGFRWHAFVEYVIKVEVKEAPGASMVLPASSRRAVLPIMVKDVATPESNTMSLLPLSVQFTLPEQLTRETSLQRGATQDRRLQSQTVRRTLRTSRLSDWSRGRGLSDAPPTFSGSLRDRAKSIFHADSLPKFTFDVTVSVPECLSLLEEGAIAIVVQAAPVIDDELTTIQNDHFPEVRIDNVTLEIGASTYIRFKSMLPRNAKTRYDFKLLDRHPVNHTIGMSQLQRISLPEKQTEVNGDARTDVHGVDLSKLPDLAPALIWAKMGLQTEKPLAPTFNTYIIAREYTLNWKLELNVAGEKVKVSNGEKIRVRVLPPKAEALEAIMQDTDATIAQLEDDDGEKDSDADTTTRKKEKSGTRIAVGGSRRKTKDQEAADEATSAGPSIANTGALQHQPGELPTYQANPTDFGYRHEIDDRPPGYEAA